MKISLKQLTLEDFKGVRSFIFTPNGENATIKGKNGVGKTRAMDAFMWLLFGKDSMGKADFPLKNLDDDNQEAHNLNHTVEGVLSIDGQKKTFKKIFQEKWTKKRKTAQKALTGHTTNYFIDDDRVQKKVWDRQMEDLITEEKFKLLTDPSYFNSLPWEDCRRIVFEVCKNISVSDEEVIASDKKLSSLPEILGNRTYDNHKTWVKEQKKEINKQQPKIKPGIEELERLLPDPPTVDIKANQDRISELRKEIEALQDDSVGAKLRKEKAELEADLAKAIKVKGDAHRVACKEIEDQIYSLEELRRELDGKASEVSSTITAIKKQVADNEARMTTLRDQYQKEVAKGSNVKDTCFACGQTLPAEEVEAAFKLFHNQKAETLAGINKEGQKIKADNLELLSNLEKKDLEREDLVINQEKSAAMIDALRQSLPAELADNQETLIIKGSIAKTTEALNSLITNDTSALEAEKREKEREIAEVEAAKKEKKRIEDRILVLEADEKRLAREFEDLEGQMSIMDKFTVRKSEMLEGKVNDRFSLARFKLFKEHINGGVEPTCTTLYHGVPWGGGLSTGERINVGLDIIKTLSEFYGIQAPVWIDNAESVTDFLVDMEGMQTIKLEADVNCPTLEVRENG